MSASKGTGSRVPKCQAEGTAAPPKARAKRQDEATDSIAFVVARFYFLRFSRQNRMSSPETT
jgi:hypothetical protein